MMSYKLLWVGGQCRLFAFSFPFDFADEPNEGFDPVYLRNLLEKAPPGLMVISTRC